MLVAAGGTLVGLAVFAPGAASADPPAAGEHGGERAGSGSGSGSGAASGSAAGGERAAAGERAAGERAAGGERAGEGEGGAAPATPHLRCNRQAAQPFLIRTNYMARGSETHEERRARHAAHDRAIRYRTEHYGYFEGFGDPSWNRHPPRFYSVTTHFMGLPVVMNRRVVPALQCVEQELHRACTRAPYRPRHLAGIRFQNTYHTGEITNHAYGIAIDVDPDRNTCCGCVGRWAEHPLCHRPARTVWDRMAMPECWVDAFERYGFYWLGHDPMHDTMHFEFLGDPDRITR